MSTQLAHQIKPAGGWSPTRPVLLQRKCACGTHTPGGGGCQSCARTDAVGRGALAIGPENDAFEREADRVADHVLSGSAGAGIGHAPLGIQRVSGQAASPVGAVPASVGLTLASTAHPLDRATRGDMEQKFGHDFSAVRVHSDNNAARSAADIEARAYTLGNDIVFGAGQYSPGSQAGRRLLAHELTHVIQQGGNPLSAAAPMRLQRTPAAPRRGVVRVAADRSKVNIPPIADFDASPGAPKQKIEVPVTFQEPSVVHLSWELYDSTDALVDGFSTLPTSKSATSKSYELETARIVEKNLEGRCLLRCVGRDSGTEPVSYADRQFFVWRTKPMGVAPDIAALEGQKKTLHETTKPGSGKGFSEVAKSFAQLKDVEHDLGVLTTGTGTHVGNRCTVQPGGTVATDCTNIVMEVLENTFTQQGKAGDWAKVKTKLVANTKLRGKTKMSGLDLQAALQSEAGWKGILWAPDPTYEIPKAELVGANSDEASFAAKVAKSKKTYLKDRPKKGYPGLSIAHSVTDYAPEQPNPGKGTASPTTKSTTQLEKLKKLPFGVLSAHGGYHMTLIMNGRVLEVHWAHEATNVDLIEQTDLEKWAIGPGSGFHFYASGAIVAPAADVDAAFK